MLYLFVLKIVKQLKNLSPVAFCSCMAGKLRHTAVKCGFVEGSGAGNRNLVLPIRPRLCLLEGTANERAALSGDGRGKSAFQAKCNLLKSGESACSRCFISASFTDEL